MIANEGWHTRSDEDLQRGSVVRKILEKVTEVVLEETLYQRVVVLVYEHPITFSPDSVTRILEYAARGLAAEHEQELLVFLAKGGLVSGGKFQPEFRLGNSYYIPVERAPYFVSPWIPTRRRFINPQGWRSGDLLITPLLIAERSIGQISVDDPRDGARPTKEKLRGLEELATVAAIALKEAYSRERMSEQRKLFHFLAENTVSGLIITQAERFCYLNDQAVELLGYPRGELLAMAPWWQVIHPEDRREILRTGGSPFSGTLKARAMRKDGSIVWLELQCRPMEYQNQAAILLNLLDISNRVQTEASLKEKALRDPLTSLFNRHYFDETIQTELKRSLRYKRPLTLMMTDLAGFKRVNDQLGHQRGDQVLHELAGVIQRQLRESDWAVRYGGDEFLIVLPETGARVETLAQRLRAAVSKWAADHLPEVPLGIDVGWATWTPEDDLPVSQLLQLADAKMYEEKAKR